MIDEDSMRQYLTNEVAARFDQPSAAPVPIPGRTDFPKGQPGLTLNIDQAVTDISAALVSPTNRVVFLVYGEDAAPRPTIQNLEILLKQNIKLSGYEGLIEIYMKDLQTNQTIHFAYMADEGCDDRSQYAFLCFIHIENTGNGVCFPPFIRSRLTGGDETDGRDDRPIG